MKQDSEVRRQREYIAGPRAAMTSITPALNENTISTPAGSPASSKRLGAHPCSTWAPAPGRMLRYFKRAHPGMRVFGIEPVQALREVAYQQGLKPTEVIDGDACALPFANGSFDFVCESAVLHHIPKPEHALAEMLRVARIGLLISDSNRFGQGGALFRRLKYALWNAGLWPVVNWIKTRGRGYIESVEDGISYSFSVFDHIGLIQKECPVIHMFNPDGRGPSPLFDAATVGLVGLKPGFHL